MATGAPIRAFCFQGDIDAVGTFVLVVPLISKRLGGTDSGDAVSIRTYLCRGKRLGRRF